MSLTGATGSTINVQYKGKIIAWVYNRIEKGGINPARLTKKKMKAIKH